MFHLIVHERCPSSRLRHTRCCARRWSLESVPCWRIASGLPRRVADGIVRGDRVVVVVSSVGLLFIVVDIGVWHLFGDLELPQSCHRCVFFKKGMVPTQSHNANHIVNVPK